MRVLPRCMDCRGLLLLGGREGRVCGWIAVVRGWAGSLVAAGLRPTQHTLLRGRGNTIKEKEQSNHFRSLIWLHGCSKGTVP